MIPLRVTAKNFGPYAELAWEVPAGLSTIVGRNGMSEGVNSNGSGKTKLLETIPVALFGPSLPWSEYLTVGSTDPVCSLALEFQHGDRLYRVRRSYDARGRGKTLLDFEEALFSTRNGHSDDAWTPLTRESQAETQALICRTIGLTESTFAHSVFAAQGSRHFADPSLQPRERKAILTEALDLGAWDVLLELVRVDRRALDVEEQAVKLRLASLQGDFVRAEDWPGQRDAAAAAVVEAEATVAAAQQTASALEAEAEKAREDFRAVAAVHEARARYNEMLASSERLRREITTAAEGDLQEALRLRGESTAHRERAVQIYQQSVTLETAQAPHCDRCGQEVRDEALQQTVAGLRAESEALERRASELQEQATTWTVQAEEASAKAAQVAFPEPPLLTAEMTELVASAPSEGDVAAATTRARAAVEAVAAEGRKAEATRTALALAEQRLESLVTLRERHAHALAEQERLAAITAELAALEDAYGRNGIPALILEARAIPEIEREAQRVLDALGVPFRVELRTQAEKRSGGTKDTLDVVVHEPRGVRRYETYSGGERTRLEFALRVGLARSVANQRGGHAGMLALDEMPYLDAAGATQMAAVLRGLTEFESIVVVSHDERLADAFDQQVVVVRDEAGSRLEEAA